MFDLCPCPKKRQAVTVTGTRPWPALWPFSSGSASPLSALPSSGEATKEIIRRQCCGSVTFWYGSGSANPYHWLPDLDPDTAFSSGADKMPTKKCFLLEFFAYFFLNVHLKQFSQIVKEKSRNSKNHSFLSFLAFWWMTDPDPRGPKTYGSGSTTLGKT